MKRQLAFFKTFYSYLSPTIMHSITRLHIKSRKKSFIVWVYSLINNKMNFIFFCSSSKSRTWRFIIPIVIYLRIGKITIGNVQARWTNIFYRVPIASRLSDILISVALQSTSFSQRDQPQHNSLSWSSS